MFCTITSAMARRLGIKIAPPPVRSSVSVRTGNKFRPQLEALDGRIVPAQFTWTGMYGTDAADTQKWLKAFEETPEWTEPYHPLPADGDDVAIGPGPFGVGSVDCVGLQVFGGGAFRSLSVGNGYTGTATFGAAITTGQFSLTGGAIAQPAAGTDLTVTDGFVWTAGTLNSSANLSTVNISGNGDITPVAAGTLSFGSTRNFAALQPKETEIKPGTLVAQNAAALTIGAYYSVKAKVLAEGDVVTITVPAPANAPVGQLTIQAGGKLNLIGPGTYNTNYYVENSGELNLTGLVRAHFTNPEGGFQYGQIDYGKLGMENGTHLYAKSKIEGGLVFLTMNPNLAANDQTATIHGYVVVSGGLILFAAPIGIGTAPYVYGTFTVEGNVDWLGGTFKPSVDYTSVGLANKWIVTGKMTSATTAKIEPNPQRGPNRPAGSNWQILLAGDTAGNLPTVTGNTGLNLTAGTDGFQKSWSLLSPPN